MSLEVNIQALTAAVLALTQQLQAQAGASAVVPQAQPQQAPQFNQAGAAAPQFQPQQPAQQMPAGPNFGAPAPGPTFAPQPVAAPFADQKGLIDYATQAYGALGAAKGAGIQNVITSLGHQNISDVRPDQYGAFFAGVEQLKAQP